MSIEIRAPWTVRLSTSRPRLSVPRRWVSEGGSSRLPLAFVTVSSGPTSSVREERQDREEDDDRDPDGTLRPVQEPADEVPPAGPARSDQPLGGRRAGWSVAESRGHVRTRGIEPAVDDVGDEVGEDDRDGQDQEDRLEHRVVARLERLLGERPETGPAEHDLDRDRAGDDEAEVDADERDRRQQGVRDGVAAQDAGLAEALGLGRRDVVLAARLDDRRAHEDRVLADEPEAHRRQRQDEVASEVEAAGRANDV